MKSQKAGLLAIVFLGALVSATDVYAQCVVSDRYNGVATIARDQAISNLSGMHFTGVGETCDYSWAEEKNFNCRPNVGGFMDDKINRVEVAAGCTFHVWEHPNYQGGKAAYPTGTWDDIQWTHVNDISSVQCKCAGSVFREPLM